MIAMIIFFLSSIYLCNLFSKKLKTASEDENFGEEDYAKLFGFSEEKQKADDSSSESELENRIDQNDGLQESIYKKRIYYTRQDLIDFYEGVRFTAPFMAYRAVKWWSFLDLIAMYANIIVTGIYMYHAFFQSVNALSFINLFLLGNYFLFVNQRVSKRS